MRSPRAFISPHSSNPKSLLPNCVRRSANSADYRRRPRTHKFGHLRFAPITSAFEHAQQEAAFASSGLIGRYCCHASRSKYPPAKPGALGIGPLKAAVGTLTRPRFCWPPKGGLSATLVESSILGLLLADV